MPRRLLAPALIVGLALACTRSAESTAPPVDAPPPEPPAVAAEIAPEPEPEVAPEPPPPPAPTLDLLATASEVGGLTTFLSAVDVAGLRDTLQGPGPFTIFVPSDRAFGALPKGELDRLLKNKKKLAALLQHHVVAGPPIPGETAVQLTNGALATAESEPSPAGAPAPLVSLAGAPLPPLPSLARADIQATNGVLHILDVVLPAPGKVKPAKPGAKATTPAEKSPTTPAAPADKPAPDKPTPTDKPAPDKSAPADKPPAPADKSAPAAKPPAPADKPPADKSAKPPADKPAP